MRLFDEHSLSQRFQDQEAVGLGDGMKGGLDGVAQGGSAALSYVGGH